MSADKKKLLILGGTRISLQILETAKSIGLQVYVADYNEDSPCKSLADKSFMTSATDIDGIAEIIKNEKIDGILMGYADVLLLPYVEICEKTGLPCYANHQSIGITSNKRKFKDYCRQYEVPVVEEYDYQDICNEKAKYPLIVKPVDNSGSRGVYICHDKDEFYQNYKRALIYSDAKDVIIERMMTDKEATVFYYLHEGEIYLLGIGDRWMYEQNNSLLKLPVGYTFPSQNIRNYIAHQDYNVRAMFKSLDMKEGLVFMQCFVHNGLYIVYEMGYRLTGSLEHHLMREQYGFDHLKAMINYAVGNEVIIDNINSLDPETCCMANVTLLLKKGEISDLSSIRRLNKIPGFISFFSSYEEGDSITDDEIGKLSQVGLRVLLKAPEKDELLRRMDCVKDAASILDIASGEMIIKNYDYKTLCR